MSKRLNLIISIAFTIIELVCLYLVVFVGGVHNTVTAFVSVVLAFFTGLIYLRATNKTYLINLAMLMTVCADFCLVILEPMNQLAGMIFFAITQTIYAIYIFLNAKTRLERHLSVILRIILVSIMIGVMIIVVRDKVDAVSTLAMYYVANLVINIVFSFWRGNAKPLFAIGLIFFLCCDIFVGLGMSIGVYFEISSSSLLYKIVYADFNFIWFFYIISQTLITLYLINTAKSKHLTK